MGNGSFIMHASTKIPPHSRCDATEPPFIVVLNHVTNRLLNVAIRLRSCMRKEKSMSTARSPLLMTRLTQRYEVAEGTTAFHLEKPAGWAFQAGQSLKNYTPESGGGRCRRRYSCVLNCECAARTIPMIIRLCDTAFERSLKSLTPQREVSIDGPFGSLTLHNNTSRTAVFLACGIGITRFRSILLDVVYRNLLYQALLVYANRQPKYAPFLKELQAIENRNATYRFVATMTHPEKSHRV